MNVTLSRDKCCFVIALGSGTDALPELVLLGVLAPDHMLWKCWPVFLKSSTCILHLLQGKKRLVGMQ